MRKCKVFVNGIEAGVLAENDNPREYIFKLQLSGKKLITQRRKGAKVL